MVAKTRDSSLLVTQDQLNERLSYSPETGVFTWIKPPPGLKVGDTAGRTNSNGYLQVWILNKRYQLHRLAFLAIQGVHPEKEIDHIDGSRTNNKWCNLRHVTSSENSKNRKLYERNKSGAAGVHYDKNTGEWVASIRVDGKLIRIGSYPLKFFAKEARAAAEKKYEFHENHGKRT